MSIKQHRSKEASLWQSAVDEIVSKAKAGGATLSEGGTAPVNRTELDDPFMAAANNIAGQVDQGVAPPTPQAPADVATLGVAEVVEFCSTTAFKLAEAKVKAIFSGNDKEVRKLEEELGAQFGSCDPKWAQVIAVYVAARAEGDKIPYRRWDKLSDFVIDGQLPANAKVALLADWGTGQDAARFVLRKIAEKKPDVVMHLGDVYYSGTAHEFQNYFYSVWQPALKLPKVAWGNKPAAPTKPATFTLSGNHDMYAGGAPYYIQIDMLGQPSSYFCLRNDDWQFIALDTGLHDADPLGSGATFLEDSEVDWVKDKIKNAGNRRSVLLSHHQLYSAFEFPGDNKSRINQRLQNQLGGILPNVTAWFWGHEHTLTVYKKFADVLARCIGHAAFPVGVGEAVKPDPNIPMENVTLSPDSIGGLFQHGYAMLELNGPSARATYYMCDATKLTETALYTETLGAAAGAGGD
ncbi:MAG: hypothetical protein FJW20_23360 [Acidimicrobiia bacterium]|nr:hypothetical protein [Acidimicrobiia bacterium]